MTKQAITTTTLKFRGYFATHLGGDNWMLRGRGERRTIKHAELQALLNARPKKKVAR